VFIRQVRHEAGRGKGRSVDVFVIEAFVSHVFGERAGVGGEAGNADADVIVDGEDFLLVGGKLGYGAFERTNDGMFRRSKSNTD